MRHSRLSPLLLCLALCCACQPKPSSSSKVSIAGGLVATELSAVTPHTIAITDENTNIICTATLIGANVGITAAHCFLTYPQIKTYYAHFTHMVNKTEQTTKARKIYKWITHSKYNKNLTFQPQTPPHDIAIFYTEGSMPPTYKPAPLLSQSHTLKEDIILAGYGNTSDTAKDAGILRYTLMGIYKLNPSAHETILTGYKTGSVFGDSGGPAYIQKNKSLYLAGIITRGTGTEQNEIIFTTLTQTWEYWQWIEDNARISLNCNAPYICGMFSAKERTLCTQILGINFLTCFSNKWPQELYDKIRAQIYNATKSSETASQETNTTSLPSTLPSTTPTASIPPSQTESSQQSSETRENNNQSQQDENKTYLFYSSFEKLCENLSQLSEEEKHTLAQIQEYFAIKDCLSLKNIASSATQIFIYNKGIQNINIIKLFPNLKELILPENKIANLSSLKELKKLEYLDLSHNYITDITELKNLPQLKYIRIKDNPLKHKICPEQALCLF